MTTAMPDERTTWLADQTMRIIHAAVDRDADTIASAIEDVSVRYGHDGVFGLCGALAGATHQLVFPNVPKGDGTLTGDTFMAVKQIHDIPDDASTRGRASLWAAQFVAAHINGDGASNAARFYGSLNDEDQTYANVAALVWLAGDAARDVVRQQQEGNQT